MTVAYRHPVRVGLALRVFGVALLLALPFGVAAAAGHRHGSLDTGFGRGGKVTTPIRSGRDTAFAVRDRASALALQKDGKLVAAGWSESIESSGFALVRYNANGTLDTSFGRGGKVTTAPLGSGSDALAIQQDGKLVAAGSDNSGALSFLLVRYNANGTLDTSFGGTGKVTTPLGVASALAIQKDGKIVAAGRSDINNHSGGVFALVRYNANGTLDRSFGRGGKVTTMIGPGAGANALAIQQDGKLVAAGWSNNRFALVRYNANGTLDTSFGRGGKVTTPLGRGAGAAALAIQQDGKLVAAGYADNGPDYDFALVRYNANGKLDTSFGRGGEVTTPVGPGVGASALAIQKDGKLVAAGEGSSGRFVEIGAFALVRYNANGTLDTSFSRGGKATTPIGSGGDGAAALAIQQDGKLVAAGSSDHGSDQVFALVRYWP
jgi:uncharacterized delta-60 repeat protein